MLSAEFDYAKSIIETADASEDWWPPPMKLMADIPREKKLTLAAWISDSAWGVIEGVLLLCANADMARDREVAADSDYEPGMFNDTIEGIDIALEALSEEVRGQLAPEPD